MEPQLKLYY